MLRSGLVAPARDERGAHRVLVGRSDGSSRTGDEAAWIGLLSLRIRTGGGPL